MSLVVPRSMVLPLTRLHVPFVSARLAHIVEKTQTERNVVCRLFGLRWRLDLTELIDFNIFYLRTYERFTSRRVMESLRSGSVFLDVGANIGYFTLRAARRVGATGHVYAFEPMQRAYDRLSDHLRLNGLSNVTAERLIVTDQSRGPQTVTFRNSWKMFGPAGNPQAPEKIDTVSLDDYVGRARPARLDAIKIDVDGYEYKVLLGAQDTLRRFRPVIVMEIGKYTVAAAGDRIDELLELLHRLDYRFYSEMTLRPYRTTRSVLNAIPDDATINVVCRHA